MNDESTVSVRDIKFWLPEVMTLLRQAGDAILEIYHQEFAVIPKADNSPVTEADIRSGQVITNGLQGLTPDIMIVSEEGPEQPFLLRQTQKYIWLLDPLDGTKEFIKKNDEFSICLALVENGTPVLGIIYAPVFKDMYYAIRGEGSFKIDMDGSHHRLPVNQSQAKDTIRILVSKSHSGEQDTHFIQRVRDGHEHTEIVGLGSALKFGRIAEGSADVYPKFGPTMEWDIAAGHIILEESGGWLIDAGNHETLTYNKEDLHNPFFIAGNAKGFQMICPGFNRNHEHQ